jgi:hypothetical protein
MPPTPPAPQLFAACGGALVDILSDKSNCGNCGFLCPANGTCSAGQCPPPPGLLSCGYANFVDWRTDNKNCGRCNSTCPGNCSSGR